MARKSKAKERNMSSSECRSNRRLALRMKSMVEGQSASSKEQPLSMKEREKQPFHKKPVIKTQPESSKGQSSATETEQPLYSQISASKRELESSKGQASEMETGKPFYNQKFTSKREPASSNKRQSTSTKKSTKKRRHLMKINEIAKIQSQTGLQKLQDFSKYIQRMLEKISLDLTISEEAITEMNIYLSYVFECLAKASSTQSKVRLNVKDIETAVLKVVEGKLAQNCVDAGRKAVKESNEEE